MSSLNRHIRSWIINRYPVQADVTLRQNRIYILPTAAGLVFLLVAMLVLLMAINYQNNLAYAVTFFMLSVFVTCTIHSYINLSGLRIQALTAEPVFAGDQVLFPYRLSSPRQVCQLRLEFEHQMPEPAVDLLPGAAETLLIAHPGGQRGRLAPPLLRITSTYPLGLFKVWTWLQFPRQALIYPRPKKLSERIQSAGKETGYARQSAQGDDEFAGLKAYRPGTAINRIAWQAFAKGQGLQVKTYQGQAGQQALWLDLSDWPELTTEQALSNLCYWVLDYSCQSAQFGLRLPGQEIPPDNTERHKALVLKALALYGKED